MTKSRLMRYPQEQDLRVGIKVSWHYYDKEADAKAASKAAVHNARILESQGYEWGYQSPGYIRHYTEGKYAGKWEVCIP